MPDLYDKQIARLRAIEDTQAFLAEVSHEWGIGLGVFAFAAPEEFAVKSNGVPCGCLTMIRSGHRGMGGGLDGSGPFVLTPNGGIDKEMTAAIAEDQRIPYFTGGVTPDSLKAFAEWQRKLDKVYGTKPIERAFLSHDEE